MAAGRHTPRDLRRRRLGQNFLRPELARQIVAEADFRSGELVLEVGAGRGALTLPLIDRSVELLAVEVDPVWAAELRTRIRGHGRATVVEADIRSLPLPQRPFRVIGSLPFAATTDILRRLLADPALPLERADLIVQWEVARKRAEAPPSTLLSTAWAPWWKFRLGRRIPAAEFRPVPRVDAGVLVITRRSPPLLPAELVDPYERFVRAHWPFARGH